jgi:cation diffusion facilitator family transporter
VAAQPPDEDHHYGHGKAEAAAAAFVGTALVAVAIAVLWESVDGRAQAYEGIQATVALGAAVLSLLGNEWLVRVTMRSAHELDSHALRALARDNRSDSLTSVLVIGGVGAALLGIEWVEPVATAVIGLFIGAMGLKSLNEGFDVLMDRVTDPEMRGRIEVSAGEVEGVVGVEDVLIHPLGSRFRVEMEVSVDGALSVRKGHEIAHEVESAVKRSEQQVVHVAVHVNPASSP